MKLSFFVIRAKCCEKMYLYVLKIFDFLVVRLCELFFIFVSFEKSVYISLAFLWKLSSPKDIVKHNGFPKEMIFHSYAFLLNYVPAILKGCLDKTYFLYFSMFFKNEMFNSFLKYFIGKLRLIAPVLHQFSKKCIKNRSFLRKTLIFHKY